MNILVVYDSVSGATSRVAAILAAEFRNLGIKTDVRKINEITDKITGYDAVLVGGPMRFGGFYKPVRAFIKRNEAELCKVKNFYFLTLLYVVDVDGEIMPDVPLYFDPSFNKVCLKKTQLSIFDKTHTSVSYLDLLLKTSSVIPDGIGFFRGCLDLSKLDCFSRVFMRIITALTTKEQVGDFINSEAIIEWAKIVRYNLQ